ncbi:hypothetical protein [Cupriavidus sp. YR651]|uniref:hypothetical protein n=1 Tax=Cupriavidus sp. YR651 TaxID=1855315 RepID=UPI0026F46C91|nr:hypothetical protein [Cupriavidus sp. YR651]
MWERYLAEEGEIEAEASVRAAACEYAANFSTHPKARCVTAWQRDELAAAACQVAAVR